MKQAPEQADSNPGFQIAPMIDVVFVIMLFFMVMAGAVKVEHELKTTLPGNAETSKETELPDEVTIGISETGEITLNEDPVGASGDKLLENLYNQMKQMGQAAEQSKTKLLITVQAEENARYERVINVLDILAKAAQDREAEAVAQLQAEALPLLADLQRRVAVCVVGHQGDQGHLRLLAASRILKMTIFRPAPKIFYRL